MPVLSIGVTGHRREHPSYPHDDTALRAELDRLFRLLTDASVRHGRGAPPRLYTLLADGTDQAAGEIALDHGWDLVVPLPFGRALNRAIVAQPASVETVRRLLAGQAIDDAPAAARVAAIAALEGRARVFEIGDRDADIARLLIGHIEAPADKAITSAYLFETAQRFALAGRVLVEQCDLIVAVWDGHTIANTGGTGDTVHAALKEGVPVLRVDPAAPESWSIFTSSEMLGSLSDASTAANEERIDRLVASALGAGVLDAMRGIAREEWRDGSSVAHHPYRRIEALFGSHSLRGRFASIRQRYERPEAIARGSGGPLVAALDGLSKGADPVGERIAGEVLPALAWIDGIATNLSDRYRSGMVVNFLLGSIAIISGMLYLPLGMGEQKWLFALVELAVLLAIVVNTARGTRRQLHARWFATRRAAEYLRQLPLMLATGVARPAPQWPHDETTRWPEYYARFAACSVGLPNARIDADWLRGVLNALRDLSVLPQRAYHEAKAIRLARVHHALDRTCELLFAAAIVSVGTYLVLAGLVALGQLAPERLEAMSKWFTIAGVSFPAVGGALAGIRYFGDFERFADISQITAQRLGEIADRIAQYDGVPDERLRYHEVADLLRANDAVVMHELASWQAVFSGKRIAVPV